MDSVENIILREEVQNKQNYDGDKEDREGRIRWKTHRNLLNQAAEERFEEEKQDRIEYEKRKIEYENQNQIDDSIKNEFYNVSEKDKIMNENVALTINRLSNVMSEIRRRSYIIDDIKRYIEIIKKGDKKKFEQNIPVGEIRKFNVPTDEKFDDTYSFSRYEGDSFSRYEGDPRTRAYFKGKSEISRLQETIKYHEEVSEIYKKQMEQLESIIKTKTRFDFRIIKYIAGNKTLFLKSFAAVTGLTILVLGTAIFLFFSFLSVEQRKKVLEKMREERKEEKEKGK